MIQKHRASLAVLTALVVLTTLILSGCASMTITLSVPRTPTINTTGIRRIAVMPFTSRENSSLHNEVTQMLTSTATTRIQGTNHFTLVNPAEIQRLQSNNESIENHVDALFTGNIISLNINESSRQVERYNYRTDSTELVTLYRREVELAFEYSFYRSRDGSIIGTASKMGRNYEEKENYSELANPSRLAQTIVSNRLADLYKDVAPYTATEKRTLEKETSKDKNLVKQMDAIFSYVKEGNYKVALNGYLDTYKTYGSVAAAINAAYLHEALGELQEAVQLMTNLYQDSGNPKAKTQMDRLNSYITEQGMLSSEYADTRSQREKVQEYAIGEIRKAINARSQIWIVNKSESGERALALQVVDGITAGLLKAGVTVVDRNNTRLMEAEENFQMSGVVSDDDFFSIGNAAGANTMITIEVTGIGSMRRLKLEVFDMSTRTTVYSSDTSANWNL
ncbi:MAG: hypothetical protein FWC03_07825 [Treponema sp.]|nr:hypothetical protein [Treponema sp.]